MPADPAAIVAAAPLSPREAAELERTERAMDQAERGWYDLGKGLHLIRTGRLYRGQTGKATWEAYCLERWELSDEHARRLMRGSEVRDVLKKTPPIGGVLPTRESHVRMLTYLAPADWPRAWFRALELAGRRRVTAKHVEAACTEILGRPPGAPPGTMSVEQMVEVLSGRLSAEQVHAVLTAKEEEVRQASAKQGSATAPDRWTRLETSWSRWVARLGRRAAEVLDDDDRAALARIGAKLAAQSGRPA